MAVETLPRRFFERTDDASYESLRTAFDWNLPERFNMGTCIDNHGRTRLGLLVVTGDRVLRPVTFGELSELSNRLASGLLALGVERGDRVAVLMPQSLETAVAHLATWKLGAISVPLSGLFGPDALRHRLEDSGTKLALVDPDHVAKVLEATPTLTVVSGRDLDRLLEAPPIEVPADTSLDDPAFLIYTSGTTGAPKGALHGHRSLFAHLPGFELVYDFAPQEHDVIWTPADWSWIAGLMDVLIPAWHYGITVVTSPDAFDPHGAVELMAAHGVSLAFLPPTALKLMRAAGVRGDGLRLRAVLSGGEALGSELVGWARDVLGCRVNEAYGQTEANLVVGNCGEAWPAKPGSMGRPLPGHDVAVIGADDRRVFGEVGELAVAVPDPVQLLEYWEQPDATREKTSGGWLRTGDLAWSDADGYLWFEGRLDDIINSRGYRIGPDEIEDSLLGHPTVALVTVVGVPDATYGEVPAAFVVLRDGVDATNELRDELRRHVRTRLAGHEVPRHVEFVDDLPRTATGKVLRRVLRDSWPPRTTPESER